MKSIVTKIFLGGACILLPVCVSAQLPKIGKPNFGKNKSGTDNNTSGNTGTNSSGSADASTNASDSPGDEKARMEIINYLNDRNGMKVIRRWFDEKDVADYSYLDYCKTIEKFDIATTRAKMAEAEKRWPEEFKSESHWVNTELKPLIVFMENNGMEPIQKQMDDLLASADKSYSEGKFEEALKNVNYADGMISGVLQFNPNNASGKTYKSKTDGLKGKLKESLKKYYTSDFHANNAGKIVFASKSLTVGGTEGGDTKQAFTIDDNVYGMVYLSSRLNDYEKDKTMFMVQYYVDGKRLSGDNANGNVLPTDLEKTYLSFPVFTPPGEGGTLPSDILRILANDITAGKHKIKMQFTTFALNMREKIIAEGEFEMDVTSVDKFKARAEAHRKAAIAKARIPAAAINNPTIEGDMMKLMKLNFNEEVTSLRATIGEANWQIVYREDTSTPTPDYRYIRGFVALKVNRTGLCYYRGIAIMQKYSGGGKYSAASSLYDPNFPYDLFEMEFANVNK